MSNRNKKNKTLNNISFLCPTLSVMDVRFKHPFSAILGGPSGCGKTYFIVNFLKYVKLMCDVNFSKITWCYDEWQPLYSQISNVNFHRGLPDMSDFEGSLPELIIIDDLMRESDSRVVDIFTKGSHHRNLSVFFITQNIFHGGRGQRDISLNANYIVCFKNPRDKAQIQHLARQLAPGNARFIQEAFNDATTRAHGYLLFDLKQTTVELYRVRTQIFPHEGDTVVYVPKKKLL